MRLFLIIVLAIGCSTGAVFAQVVPAPLAKAGSETSMKTPQASKQLEEARALADCERMWERATHMTKQEWSRTCRRVHERFRQLDAR